jgi:hypothetical protein
MDKKTPMLEEKTSNLAQRLKEKLAGSPVPINADEIVAELVESELDVVSGGHNSHESVASDLQSPTGDKK